ETAVTADRKKVAPIMSPRITMRHLHSSEADTAIYEAEYVAGPACRSGALQRVVAFREVFVSGLIFYRSVARRPATYATPCGPTFSDVNFTGSNCATVAGPEGLCLSSAGKCDLSPNHHGARVPVYSGRLRVEAAFRDRHADHAEDARTDAWGGRRV